MTTTWLLSPRRPRARTHSPPLAHVDHSSGRRAKSTRTEEEKTIIKQETDGQERNEKTNMIIKERSDARWINRSFGRSRRPVLRWAPGGRSVGRGGVHALRVVTLAAPAVWAADGNAYRNAGRARSRERERKRVEKKQNKNNHRAPPPRAVCHQPPPFVARRPAVSFVLWFPSGPQCFAHSRAPVRFYFYMLPWARRVVKKTRTRIGVQFSSADVLRSYYGR